MFDENTLLFYIPCRIRCRMQFRRFILFSHLLVFVSFQTGSSQKLKIARAVAFDTHVLFNSK